MLEIRAGRLETAEAAANRCFEHGTDVGDADALAYYGMQLLVIRWAQGRGHEILPFVEEIASSTTLVWGNEAYVAAAAGLAGVSGDLTGRASCSTGSPPTGSVPSPVRASGSPPSSRWSRLRTRSTTPR